VREHSNNQGRRTEFQHIQHEVQMTRDIPGVHFPNIPAPRGEERRGGGGNSYIGYRVLLVYLAIAFKASDILRRGGRRGGVKVQYII